MRFSMPTNFDPLLIEQAKDYPVDEVYGKLTADVIGGGRLSQILPSVSFPRLRAHLALCKKHGISFNYLLNAANSDNTEYTREGQKHLTQLVDKLWETGVRRFTAATPYLLKFLKSRHRQAWVKISVFAQVGDSRKARQWEDMGADEIVLDSLLVNRDFKALEKIRSAVKISLQLLVNNNCYYGCSLSPYHMNVIAAGSRLGSRTSGFLPDYCYLHCTGKKLRDPARYLMADWIRPEDLSLYEGLGYDNFKLAGRNMPAEVLIKRMKAYAERQYDGDLLDLVQDFGRPEKHAQSLWTWRSKMKSLLVWFRHSAPLNPAAWFRLLSLNSKQGFLSAPRLEPPVYVDNRALDGFLGPIIRMGGCRNRLCEDCNYCNKVASKAVIVREASRTPILNAQEALVREIESGDFWRL
jgi:collagenase-like PrtC family protease